MCFLRKRNTALAHTSPVVVIATWAYSRSQEGKAEGNRSTLGIACVDLELLPVGNPRADANAHIG